MDHNGNKFYNFLCQGPFKCYVTLFFWKLDPHPPPRNGTNANNIEHYTFVMLFSRKSDTPYPHLRYVTLEWPLILGFFDSRYMWYLWYILYICLFLLCSYYYTVRFCQINKKKTDILCSREGINDTWINCPTPWSWWWILCMLIWTLYLGTLSTKWATAMHFNIKKCNLF